MSEYVIVNGELKHYGVKGMEWGVRRAAKRLASADTYEKRSKAMNSLEKHRRKTTSKINKLNKQHDKLQKKMDKTVYKNDPKAADLYAKAAKLRSKKYGLFTSESKADKLESKALKLENRANKLKTQSDQIKAYMNKNERMKKAFETGLDEIDRIMSSTKTIYKEPNQKKAIDKKYMSKLKNVTDPDEEASIMFDYLDDLDRIGY